MALIPASSFSGQIPQHTWLTALDVVQPDIASIIVDAYGNNEYMKEIMYHYMQTKSSPVSNSDGWSWFDELRIISNITVLANSGTATTNLSFTIGGTGSINTLGGQRTVYPAPSDVLIDMATGQVGRIYSVVDGGTNFTIQATGTSNWTAPTAGKQYAIYSSAEFEDAQTLPNAKDSYLEKKRAYLQRFASVVKITTDAESDKLWVNTREDGSYFGSWGGKQRIDCENRLNIQRTAAMWLGTGSIDGTLPSMTGSIWKSYEAEATPIDYTAAGMTISEAREVFRAMKGNGAFGPQSWTLPELVNGAVQALFQDQGALTNLNIEQQHEYSAGLLFENIDNKSRTSLMRMFDTTTAILDGTTINVRLMNLSYDKVLFGTDFANNVFIRKGFLAPCSRTKDNSGNSYSQVEMRYKSGNGLNLMSTYGEIGWTAKGGANSEALETKTGWRSHMGFGIRGVTQSVLLNEA